MDNEVKYVMITKSSYTSQQGRTLFSLNITDIAHVIEFIKEGVEANQEAFFL